MIDSLDTITGREKIDLLNRLSEEYLLIEPLRSIEYGKEAYNAAVDSNLLHLESDALLNIGKGHYLLGNYEPALENYESALLIYSDLKDQSGLARSYNNLGLIYNKLGKSDLALEYNLKSLEIEEKAGNDMGVAKSYCNIGNLYFEMEKNNIALEYFNKCLTMYEELNDPEGLADILNNIGIVYDEEGKYDIALDYYLSSLAQEELLQDPSGIATTCNNIGLAYYNLGSFDLAFNYLNRSLKLTQDIGEQYGIANSYFNLSRIHLAQGNETEALKLLNRSLRIAEQIKAGDILMSSYKLLSETYASMNNYAKALENFKLYVDHRDDFFQDNQRDLSFIQTEYELNKREKGLQQTEKRIKNYLYILAIMASIIVLLITITIVSRNRFGNKFILEQKKINSQLVELAQTDPLTNLANRRGMLEKIQQASDRFKHRKESFSIVLCDIDGFKKVNDKFGHECGDFVLSSLSNLFVSQLREHDIIGRWGGEEFIMVLPETTLEGGVILAEKIRLKVRDNVFYYKGYNIWITITMGVAVFDHITDIKEVIHQADEAMYRGKSAGRNCVMN